MKIGSTKSTNVLIAGVIEVRFDDHSGRYAYSNETESEAPRKPRFSHGRTDLGSEVDAHGPAC